MEQLANEAYLFRLLRPYLRHDLVSCHGFPNPIAGSILNWFDPAKSEYLDRVDAWQAWLCSMTSTSPALPSGMVKPNAFGYYDITSLPIHQIGAIHQVAKLLYKYHGIPRRETDWGEVKDRLHRARPVTLDEFEITAIKDELSLLGEPDLNSVIGRFGPGATYEGFDAYDKWSRKGRIPNLPPSFFRSSLYDQTNFQAFGPGITKIAEVPKTIKSNRIVSSEPAMYMYAQLGVADWLTSRLHAVFPQHISLYDAERHNTALRWPSACSIDLSDASDHVSVRLVKSVLPQLWPVLATVRSTASLFPDGDCINLDTFAPMGSGVCFPVMTAVICGILRYACRVIHEERKCHTWFHVYGDDIIVPVSTYDFTLDLLERAGLVVNRRKSCCTLFYRESCGCELFCDSDITPAYIRDPLDQVDAAKVEQLATRLESLAFPSTAAFVADMSSSIRSVRWNRALQRQEVLVRVTSARQKIKRLDGYDGLNRWYSLRTRGQSSLRREPQGVATEVWTRPSWRYRASEDYPYLTTRLVTGGARGVTSSRQPEQSSVAKPQMLPVKPLTA